MRTRPRSPLEPAVPDAADDLFTQAITWPLLGGIALVRLIYKGC